MTGFSIPDNMAWGLGDDLWADFSTPEGWQLSDPLRTAYFSFFENETDAKDESIRLLEVMDAFAYLIIMGYASEKGSFQSVIRYYYTYGNFIMPHIFRYHENIGIHATLLYRLWRIRYELIIVGDIIPLMEKNAKYKWFMSRIDHLLCYEGAEITEASLKAYRKKLEKKLKEMQKEIEVFRKNSLK
jgi:hypothetical protein